MNVTYEHDIAEGQRLQQVIAEGVDRVVAEVVSEGMGDADKVTAINNWLVNNVEYDYPAFDALLANGNRIPDGFEYAWSTAGVFEQGAVVCQFTDSATRTEDEWWTLDTLVPQYATS